MPSRRAFTLSGLAALAGGGCASSSLPYSLTAPSRQSLIARYRLPQSRFVTVDGVDLHYTDEGAGRPLVLMHGNIGSLRMWADWVGPLTGAGFRVIRLDFPGHGLTGPDGVWTRPNPPESMDRYRALVTGLLDHLGVERCAIAATSFSGIVAYRMAARQPERVSALALINSGGLPRTRETDPNRVRGTRFEQWRDRRTFTRERMERVLTGLMAPERPPTPALIEEYHALQNMQGRQMERATGTPFYRSGDVAGTLALVRQPTLILWGDYPGLLDVGQARQFQSLLVNAPVTLKVYPGVGHLLPIEAAQAGVGDLIAFLADEGADPPRPG
jgi:pimeloyl-ACP methyl ester carboxylesterase